MVIVWRGIGIIVPIFLLIGGWIVSYWFDDTRLGNPHFMGWTLFWTSIPLLLVALALFGARLPDPDTGEKPPKSYNDFFFIPVWIWAFGFLIIGIILINKEKEAPYVPPPMEEESTRFEGTKTVNFYNPLADTITVIVEDADEEVVMEEAIPPTHIRWKEFDAGMYTVYYGDEKDYITVLGSKAIDNDRYDNGWYVFGGEHDLILLDVNEACSKEIVKSDLIDINWSEKIVDRYSGDNYLIPRLKPRNDFFFTVYEPGITLPLELQDKEKVYALVSIPVDLETTEEYLDSAIVSVCFD